MCDDESSSVERKDISKLEVVDSKLFLFPFQFISLSILRTMII